MYIESFGTHFAIESVYHSVARSPPGRTAISTNNTRPTCLRLTLPGPMLPHLAVARGNHK